MNATRLSFAWLAIALAAGQAAAAPTQTPYVINAGGQFEYKPSPMGPGIPGGSPGAYELAFGISGSLTYELDVDAQTARLLNLHLTLTGNEAIQAAPPAFGLVTADRVEEFLASQMFVEDFIGGLVHLESSTHPNLKLTDFVTGSIAISGGYDARPVDGDGVEFQFSAVAVPEPAGASLAGAAAIPLLRRRRVNHKAGAPT
jgi:hypothetical protein